MFDLLRYPCFPFFITRILTLARGLHAYDPEASITGLYTGPYFDPLAPRNLTAHLGDRADLPCTVRQLGDKSVSWVRMRDADILTVDRYTFVGDERFEAHYSIPAETWNLIINYVQERDAGDYECQVSTEPKMSQFFNLRVVVPQVNIEPPGDRHVKAGSQVRIDCHITDVVQIPDYIFWYHDNLRVLDRTDGNLDVMVTRTGEESIMSSLHIERVRKEQSGNYTCMPSNLHAAFTLLHVLNEEHPAAMQDGRNSASLILVETELLFFAAFIFFFFFIDITGSFWSNQHPDSFIEIMSAKDCATDTSDKMHNVKITSTTASNTDANNVFILIVNSLKNNVCRDVIKQIIIKKCSGYCDKENKYISANQFVSFQGLSKNAYVTKALNGCFYEFHFVVAIQHDYDNQRFFDSNTLAMDLSPRSLSFHVINPQKIVLGDCIHALHKLTLSVLGTIAAGFTGQRGSSVKAATQFDVTPLRLQIR